ncbi:MAG: hypothetical protein WA687_05500 [Solirubrobacterales bacterium]
MPRRSERRRRRRVFAGTVFVALALAAPSAQATFHEILIREVYAGGATNDSYVVLQAYTSGQNLVSGHAVTAYNAAGNEIGSFTFNMNVANGQSQMTILVADTSYASTFPTPTNPAPDGSSATLNLNPTGGAVCWANLDCVAWGSFNGTVSPSPGVPAAAPAGMAIRRMIVRGSCANRLDPGDSTDDSAEDFALQTPHPRSNASPIEEGASCVAPQLPVATIDTNPASFTQTTSAAFTFHSTPDGADFECRLDAGAYAECNAGTISYPGPLANGSHSLRVRAKNANGTGSPDIHQWTIDTTPPVAEIRSQPKDPSSGKNAAFTYSSNEPGSSFQCSLDSGGGDSFSACPSSGKTFTGLANGEYTFKVRATDKAGNQGAPDSYTWDVDNSLIDETPPPQEIPTPAVFEPPFLIAPPPSPAPQTIISAKPGAATRDRTPTFRFRADVSGATFECKVDRGAFRACSSPFTTKKLTFGAHGVEVRAVAGGSADPTPAKSSFRILKPKRKKRRP